MSMPRGQNREILFAISDVGRLIRTYADYKARRFGQTRAQWAVLTRLQRCEGVNQAELADSLDLAPITLARLIDKLTAAGMVSSIGVGALGAKCRQSGPLQFSPRSSRACPPTVERASPGRH